MHEALEDAGNSNTVLRTELEELAKVQKAAEEKVARLEAEQKEYDQLVVQTDAHAYRKFLPFPFSNFCL
jgi:peptidoglycan hydrolase CwlO-like protein